MPSPAARFPSDRSVSPFAAPAFGFALFVLGVAFLRRHRRTWRERKNDPHVDLAERTYYRGQYRRRMVTSGLLVALGLLIPIGDQLLDRRFAATMVILFWAGVMSLVLVVLLLGLVDFFATSMHTKDAMLRVRGEKAALERHVDEFRRALRERPGGIPDTSRPTENGRTGNLEHRETRDRDSR